MARRALVEILGNAEGFKRATRESVAASNTLSHGLKRLGVDAKASANMQVAASVKKTNRMRTEIAAYREIASSARKGSREQVVAANLAANAEKRMARALGVTSREQRELAVSASRSEHMIGRGVRGAVAGSGAFRSMGRSLAFASGAFIGVAGVSSFLRSSVDAAVEASATQKQLAAQFRASGMNLKDYQKQIDETTGRLSSLSGFTKDDLIKTFTTAFRGTKNVETALKLESVAADAARGSHKNLATVSLALTKGVLGSSGALRRLGIIVPKTAHGMQVLNFVQRKFAGQAQAGTTAQQRFSAELHNSQVIIGAALLPVITRLLAHGARWLAQMNRTGRLQRNVNSAVRIGTRIFHGFAAVITPMARAIRGLSHVLGGAQNMAKLFAGAFVGMKILKWAGEMRILAGTIRGVAGAEMMAGAAGGGLGGAGIKGLGRKLLLAAGIRGGALGGAAALGATGATVGLAGALAIYTAGSEGGPSKGDPHFQENVGKRFRTLDQISGDKNFPDSIPAGKRKQALAIYTAFRKGEISKATAERMLSKLNPYNERITGAGGNAGAATRDSPGRDSGRFAAPTTAGGGGGNAGPGPLGLKARFSNLELRLAQAGLTSGQGDDKTILRQEAANLRAQIARLPRDHKHLQERTQLYQQLGQVQSQIQSIDQTAAQKQKDAHDKQLTLKKKERERDKKHKDKVEAEEKKQDEQEKKHREALKRTQDAIRQKMAEAVTNARSLIGDLFSGPVLNPSEADRKRQLGVRSHQDPKRLIADVIAQTKAFRGTTRDLGVLRKSGASRQLISELEGTDPEQLHALATASPKVRKQFLQAFAQRQKAIQSRARFDIHSPHVTVAAKRIDIGGEITVVVHTHNHVDGKEVSKTVTKHQRRATQRNAAQRTGRHAGTVPHP